MAYRRFLTELAENDMGAMVLHRDGVNQELQDLNQDGNLVPVSVDEGLGDDVEDEAGELAFSGKILNNYDDRRRLYCTSASFVIIRTRPDATKHFLCGLCYISYTRIVSGRHQHVNIHKTTTLDGAMITKCKCCSTNLVQLHRIEVCHTCNNVNKTIA